MKTFKPFTGNHVEIKPIEKKGVIQQENNYINAGEIVTLSNSDSGFGLKIGDIIFFESYGCYQTTDQVDGQIHYIVTLDKDIVKAIYGE